MSELSWDLIIICDFIKLNVFEVLMFLWTSKIFLVAKLRLSFCGRILVSQGNEATFVCNLVIPVLKISQSLALAIFFACVSV